jgi:hypothetical protein
VKEKDVRGERARDDGACGLEFRYDGSFLGAACIRPHVWVW